MYWARSRRYYLLRAYCEIEKNNDNNFKVLTFLITAHGVSENIKWISINNHLIEKRLICEADILFFWAGIIFVAIGLANRALLIIKQNKCRRHVIWLETDIDLCGDELHGNIIADAINRNCGVLTDFSGNPVIKQSSSHCLDSGLPLLAPSRTRVCNKRIPRNTQDRSPIPGGTEP